MAVLRWSDAAIDDLHAIRAPLAAEAARRIGRVIVEASDCLMEFPDRGGPGRAARTRELPLPGLPWRLVYGVAADGAIIILRVLAGG